MKGHFQDERHSALFFQRNGKSKSFWSVFFGFFLRCNTTFFKQVLLNSSHSSLNHSWHLSHYHLFEWIKSNIGERSFSSFNLWPKQGQTPKLCQSVSSLCCSTHSKRNLHKIWAGVFLSQKHSLPYQEWLTLRNTVPREAARKERQLRERISPWRLWDTLYFQERKRLSQQTPSFPYISVVRAGSHVYFMSIAKPPSGQGKWVTMSGLDNSFGAEWILGS